MQRPYASFLPAVWIALAILAIGALHYLTPLRFVYWHGALQNLYFLPIVGAGFAYGWRGGLAAALFSSLVQIPHLLETWTPMHTYAVGQILEMPMFCAAGLLSGILVERERKQREELARTTRQLSDVYQQLQRNFEEMKRAERLSAVGQLAAGLAHEIRNPLASIAGASGILRRNAHLDEKHLKCVEVINKECQRLTHLLSTFLDFARPRQLRCHPVDVKATLNSVVELASHAVGNKPITLRKDFAHELPSIECDPELLRQLLLNLVINAIQSMDNGGEVVVSATCQSGRLRIRVTDDGCGIAPEFRDKIFDPFFTTKEGGTGLGLSVAHQIVEQHGGVLTAEANAGRGMTFTALLPLKQEVLR